MIKDTKYIIKRVLIGIFITLILSFFNSCEVHAESNALYLPNTTRQFKVSPSARFYSLNGLSINNSSNSVSTNFGYYATQDNVTSNGSGELLCFENPNGFVDNAIYSITLYIGSDASGWELHPIPNVNYQHITLGKSIDEAAYRWTQQISSVNLYSFTNSPSTISLLYEDLNQSVYYTGYLNLVLESNYNFPEMCVPFNFYTTNFHHTIFYGYDINILGYNNGLKTSDIQNVINGSGLATAGSIQELQTSINSMKTEISSSIDKQTQQQQQNHQETIDTITSSEIDNPSSNFNEFESYLPENGVITNLITLPVTLFQKVLTSINGTCNSYNLGNLYGTDLILPCINISSYIGTTVWNVIDVLFSGLFVLVIARKMIKVFNSFSSLEEGDILG